MTTLQIQLALTMTSALSVGAGGSAGTLADKTIMRDGWGRPIIPGSQVKGKLRWAAEQVLRTIGQQVIPPFDDPGGEPNVVGRARVHHLIAATFGSKTARSPLIFADLPSTLVPAAQAYQTQHHVSQLRTSVAINRARGVAEDKRLLVLEAAHEGTVFANDRAIVGVLTPETANACAGLLWAACTLTERWGGATSRGLGWASSTCTILLDNVAQDETTLATLLRQTLHTAQGAAAQ